LLSAATLWVFPVCYLLGSLPFGVLYGKLVKGIDIRQYGSGNIGASNVMRLFGVKAFVIVFVLDALKGVAAVLLCQRYLGPEHHWLVLLGGLLAVVGHTFSVFLKFAGGRGVATGLGLAVAVAPVAALCALLVWGVVLALTRFISLASIVASFSAPLWAFLINYPHPTPLPYRLMIVAAAVIVIMRHRANIKRLLSGKEYRLGQRVAIESGESREQPPSTGEESP